VFNFRDEGSYLSVGANLGYSTSFKVPQDRAIEATSGTSVRMRSVRQRDTALERKVRSLLHGLGIRFRVCAPELPGRPDVVNRKHKWCIFIHGCFWHGHIDCKLARLPKSNNLWWTEKISRNRARDKAKEAEMRALGFRVETVWQCELRQPNRLSDKLLAFVSARTH
jgi:DNA mismatch endonuclease (patch repair protein)